MDNKKFVLVIMMTAGVLEAIEGVGSPFKSLLEDVELNSPRSRRAINMLAHQLRYGANSDDDNMSLIGVDQQLQDPLNVHPILRGSSGHGLNTAIRMPEFTLVTQVYRGAQHVAYPLNRYLLADSRDSAAQDIAQTSNLIAPAYYGLPHGLSDGRMLYLAAPQPFVVSPFLSTAYLPSYNTDPIVQHIRQIHNPVAPSYYGVQHRLSDGRIFYLAAPQAPAMSPFLSQSAVYATLSSRVEEFTSARFAEVEQNNYQFSDDADDVTVSDERIAQDYVSLEKPSKGSMVFRGISPLKSHTFHKPERSQYETEQGFLDAFSTWNKARKSNSLSAMKTRAKKTALIEQLASSGVVLSSQEKRKFSIDGLRTLFADKGLVYNFEA